jgi:hypothetical protein
MRIDSSGNLLVGTTDTSAYNNSANSTADSGLVYENGHSLSVARYNAPVTYLNRTGSDGTVLELRKSGSTVGSIGASGGDLIVGTGDTGLYFYDGADTVIPWNISSNSSRNGSIDLGASSHRFKDLYLSGGVHLGGTGSANKLDDYEEGTWTPASGTAGITTTGSPSGTYTKIGRIIYYTFNLQFYKTGSGSANVALTGLPFSGTGGILQFTRFEPTGIAYQWINGSTSGTSIYFTRPAGTAPGTSGSTNNNAGQVLEVDDISATTNSALQSVVGYGWYSA